jgi:hypothetical protein
MPAYIRLICWQIEKHMFGAMLMLDPPLTANVRLDW